MHAHAHIYAYTVHTHWTYICTSTCTYLHIHTRTYARTCTYKHRYMHECTDIIKCIHMHIRIQWDTDMHIPTCVAMAWKWSEKWNGQTVCSGPSSASSLWCMVGRETSTLPLSFSLSTIYSLVYLWWVVVRKCQMNEFIIRSIQFSRWQNSKVKQYFYARNFVILFLKFKKGKSQEEKVNPQL